jgi:hypothetical protein
VSIDEVYQRPHRHHIGLMSDLDLSDEEAAAESLCAAGRDQD